MIELQMEIENLKKTKQEHHRQKILRKNSMIYTDFLWLIIKTATKIYLQGTI